VTTPSTLPKDLAPNPGNWRKFLLASAVLFFCFAAPLFQLARFALNSELYSYIILIPVVSAYLVWLKRPQLAPSGERLSPVWTMLFGFAGAGLLVGYLLNLFSADPQVPQDILALAMGSLVLLFIGLCCKFLSQPTLRAVAFPVCFLVFLAPLPIVVENGLETFLQHGSSIVAQSFFQIIGTPVFRDGTVFHLPGFTMQVAPECSGIHSTLALFITSLVAGQVLLRSPRNQALLALAVLPIALFRNGLRITTIGELCVRIGPEMINSYIHRQGGPIFFIVSLVPFSLLLILLLKIDRKGGSPAKPIV
jgi:exosortase C (VPDSG-CTERM-specific)